MNYYNEFDPFAAQWLRNLISAGHIAPGDVDERSILEVKPDDIRKYTQAHFFAGIGGWSLALRLAGIPDDFPVWTGSCPCQPFSVAGKAKAQEDERHLWPVWFKLIAEVRPPVVFGEQVAGAIAHGWLDDASDDLEREGYETGAAVLPACSVGAPHKRDRLWFIGSNPTSKRYECGKTGNEDSKERTIESGRKNQGVRESIPCDDRGIQSLANSSGSGRLQRSEIARGAREGKIAPGQRGGLADSGSQDVAYANQPGSQGRNGGELQERPGQCTARPSSASVCYPPSAGLSNRAAKPMGESRTESQPERSNWWEFEPDVGRVANGIPARAHKLRGYGNAIVPQVAAEFIKAAMLARPTVKVTSVDELL